MSDEGRELMREERTQQHQGGNQNKGHQQGNGMHNQVITQSDRGCAIPQNYIIFLIISKGGDTEHCWRAGPHRAKLPHDGGPAATTAGSEERGVEYRT